MSVPRKWRPSLHLVVFAVLAVVAALPLAGVLWLQLHDRKLGWLVAGAVAAAILAIGFVFARAITRPIHLLIRQTREIATGRQGHADPHYGTREIALLSQSFAGMARRLEERAAYIGTFAAHVSHELKSPLTAIRGAAELLQDGADMGEAQRARFLANIASDAERLTLLLERLQQLARADNPESAGSCTAGAAIDAMAQAFPALALSCAGDRSAAMAMSRENAAIVLSHLADNAQRHGARALSVAIGAGDDVVLEIGDDGAGISAGNRARIFDAFFTTRREAGGTGMGLHIVRSMLRSHGGGIELLESAAGARFRLRIRAAAA